jgi:cobaltochelatase CobT
MSITLRDEFEGVAKMLADKFDIQLDFKAGQCNTDGRRITLPMLPSSIGPQVKAALHGYLDHEVGHIVGQSCSNLLQQAARERGELGAGLLNALEDVRIEKLMETKYPGCGFNFRQSMDLTEKENVRKYESGEMNPSGAWTTGVAAYLIGKGLPHQCYIDDEIWQVMSDMKDLCKKAATANDTAETWAIAQEILDRLKQEADNRQPPPPPGEGEQPGQGGQNGGQAGKGSNKAPGKSGGKPGDGKAEAPGAGNEAAPGGDGRGEPGGSEPVPQGSEGGSSENGSGLPKAPEVVAVPWEKDGSAGSSRSEAINKAVSEELGNLGESAATDWEIRNSATYEIASEKESNLVNSTLKSLASEAGGVRQRMIQLVRSEDRSDWQRELPAGRLDGARLFALRSGINCKVFRRKTVTSAPNTAVTLLIDTSESMNKDSRLKIAIKSAILLGDCLERLGQAFEIVSFAYGRDLASAVKLNRPYANEQVPVLVSKPFNRRIRDCGDALGSLFPDGWTPFAGGLYRAGKRLAARREPRRILIALTDGNAYSNQGNGYAERESSEAAAKREVKLLTAVGIEVLMIGIGCSAHKYVEQYGVPWISVEEVSGLPKKMIGLLMQHEKVA